MSKLTASSRRGPVRAAQRTSAAHGVESLEGRRMLSAATSFASGELIVGFRPGVSPADITRFYAQHGFAERKALDRPIRPNDSRLKLVAVPPAQTMSLIPAPAAQRARRVRGAELPDSHGGHDAERPHLRPRLGIVEQRFHRRHDGRRHRRRRSVGHHHGQRRHRRRRHRHRRGLHAPRPRGEHVAQPRRGRRQRLGRRRQRLRRRLLRVRLRQRRRRPDGRPRPRHPRRRARSAWPGTTASAPPASTGTPSIMALKTDAGSGNAIADLIDAYNYLVMMRSRGVDVRVTNNSYGTFEVGHITRSWREADRRHGASRHPLRGRGWQRSAVRRIPRLTTRPASTRRASSPSPPPTTTTATPRSPTGARRAWTWPRRARACGARSRATRTAGVPARRWRRRTSPAPPRSSGPRSRTLAWRT